MSTLNAAHSAAFLVLSQLNKEALDVAVFTRNPLVYLFGKTWHYSEENRKNVVLYWILFIVSESLNLLLRPLLWAQILNTIQLQGITQASIYTLTCLLAGTFLLEIAVWCFHGPARLIEQANAYRARTKYLRHLLHGVMSLPLEWHSEHHSGRIIDKIMKGTGGLYDFSGSSFQVIYAVVQLSICYCMLSYFCPPAGGIVLGMVLVMTVIIVRFDRVIIAQYHQINHAENKISESVFDAVSNITTVVMLRVEKLVFNAIAHKVEQPFALVKRNNLLNEWKWFLISACCYCMVATVLGIYFWQHVGGEVLMGSVMLLYQYLNRMSEIFFRFTDMYGQVLLRRARVANAEEMSEDFRPTALVSHVLPRDWHILDIRNLTFSYGDGRVHLDDVSLTIRRGERIALVGETGSGKTTLLKVMRQLYEAQQLGLYVDGEEIAAGFAGISEAIALVPQDPEIFATTIIDNITIGAEYDCLTTERFIEMACFAEVVHTLPHGLTSSINEKGVNLSGGQRQRLALARGLLACRDKDIVLLDEPTSSLDAATEMRVYENIFQGLAGKTIISSIHRLHLLRLFDRVCFFKEGRLIASGSLSELLETCPDFVRLWETMQTDTVC